MRALLALVCCGCLVAGDPALRLTFVETLSGRPPSGSERAVIERLRAQQTARLAAARSALPQAPPTLAPVIRADIAAFEAELERLAWQAGGEIAVGRRTLTIDDARFVLEADGTTFVFQRAEGQGWLFQHGREAAPVAIQPPPAPLPLAQGQDGPAVAGRATRRFTFALEGRDFVALVDPTLPNAFAWLLPSLDASPLAAAIARLPGLPLLIACEHGGLTRRLACLAIE